jgi:hypothetical protein
LEKGVQRAEAVLDQKEKKVERSRGRAGVIKERAVSFFLFFLSPHVLWRTEKVEVREANKW